MSRKRRNVGVDHKERKGEEHTEYVGITGKDTGQKEHERGVQEGVCEQGSGRGGRDGDSRLGQTHPRKLAGDPRADSRKEVQAAARPEGGDTQSGREQAETWNPDGNGQGDSTGHSTGNQPNV